MTESLSPSQIGKLQESLGAALRKINPFTSEEGQDLIENHWSELKDEVVEALVGAVNRVLERMRNIIIRKVTVNRNRTPQQALDATGRRQYTDKSVVKAMPCDGKAEEEVVFFYPGRRLSCVELAAEYERRGRKPDPLAQIKANEDDSAFADKHPTACQWQDADGNWCYIAFYRHLDGERYVYVGRSAYDWDDHWWFAGVRKS